MPRLSLVRLYYTTGASSTVGYVDDYSVSYTAYQTYHSFFMAISHAVDNTSYRYHIALQSETGANSLAGLKVYDVQITYTTARLDED
jgi:hypothetical protein